MQCAFGGYFIDKRWKSFCGDYFIPFEIDTLSPLVQTIFSLNYNYMHKKNNNKPVSSV